VNRFYKCKYFPTYPQAVGDDLCHQKTFPYPLLAPNRGTKTIKIHLIPYTACHAAVVIFGAGRLARGWAVGLDGFSTKAISNLYMLYWNEKLCGDWAGRFLDQRRIKRFRVFLLEMREKSNPHFD
jgi:hypothetical protein